MDFNRAEPTFETGLPLIACQYIIYIMEVELYGRGGPIYTHVTELIFLTPVPANKTELFRT